MTRMMQIYEDDLADLEQAIPKIADRLMDGMDNALRTKVRRIQRILSSVRWGYGPPSHVEKFSSDDDPTAQQPER